MAPIANLTVRVSAQIAEFQKSFEDASKTASKFAGDFEGIATRAAAVGSFIGNIASDIAGSLARGLGSALKDAVKFSSEFSNAFLGLGSVAKHFGADTDLAAKAAKSLSSDGLLPLKDSATGLKNLLATGFNLEQSTKLMDAFKDSAAFGRQGALSFGDAVRSATEGVKNGNSILVDNAGITKNLSQILTEAGFSAQDLSKASTDAGVRMALYNGILKESAAFSGDAAKLTQTYTGQVTRLQTAYDNTLASIGTVITQNATVALGIGAVSDALLGLNSGLSDNRAGFNLVSDAVVAFVGVLAGTVRAVDTVQGAFNTIDTAIVTFTSHVLEGVKTLADQLINLVRIAMKIPGSSLAIAGMSDEIVGLLAISAGAGQELQTLATRIKDNEDRSNRWHGALSGLAGQLDTLKGNMTEMRGKTVELGTSSEKVGNQLSDGIGGGSKKAAAEAKKLSDQLQSTRDDIFDLDRKIGHFGDAFLKSVDAITERINGVPVKEKAQEWAEALKEPAAIAKTLADAVLRKELGDALSAVEKHFGSLKAAGLDALEGIQGAVSSLVKVVKTIPIPLIPELSTKTLATRGPIPKAPESSFASLFDPKKIATAFTDAIDQGLGSAAIATVMKSSAIKVGEIFATDLAFVLRAKTADIGGAVGTILKDAITIGTEGLSALFNGGLSGLAASIKQSAIRMATDFTTTLLATIRSGSKAISFGSKAAAVFGGASGGELGASIAGIASGLGGAAIAATSWGTAMAGAGVAGTVALGAATLGIGAAAVGAAALIKHFTDHKGRDAVKDFAASFGGFDALRTKLSDLGDEGERLWIRLTQGTGRGDPKSAAAAAQDVANALANAPQSVANAGAELAAAAGFHTRDEFIAVEKQAKKTYDFMLESGKFTAAELSRAFDAYSAAQKAAMDDGGASVDAAAEKVKALSAEFDSLSKSVSAEAPEEVMGVIEEQQRARLKAIAEEKTAIQLQADAELEARRDTLNRSEIEAKDSHQRTQEYLTANELEVLFHYRATNTLPVPGSTGIDVPALANGGIVRRPTLALVGEKGPEAVVPLSQMGRGGGGQPMLVQLLMPNGQVLLEQMVKAGKREAVW